MRNRFIALSALTLLIISVNGFAKRPNFFTIDGQKFSVTKTDNFDQQAQAPSTHPALTEYLPAKQNNDSWKNLIGLRKYKEENDPAIFATNFAKFVDSGPGKTVYDSTKQYPKADDSMIVFYVTSNEDDDHLTEVDFWRFVKDPKTSNMISVQYAIRHYGKNGTQEFIKRTALNPQYLKKIRDQLNVIPLNSL